MSELTKRAKIILPKLKKRDIKALKWLYDLRCLTQHQIYLLSYSDDRKANHCKQRLRIMCENDVIEEVVVPGSYEKCYFLKTHGVNIVKYSYCLPNTIYDEARNITIEGCLSAGMLKLKDKYINHQLKLNLFYVDLLKKIPNTHMHYRDCKHAEKYEDVMPDAILDINGITFFLEMDMGTESKKQLNQKWCHYRQFIRSYEYKDSSKKIVVLFILDGISKANPAKLSNRKRVVELEAYTILNSEIDNNFDIYIGSSCDIIEAIKNKLLHVSSNNYISHNDIKNFFINKFNYGIISGDLDASYFSGTKYLYIAKERVSTNPLTFVIDECFYSPFQAINKVCCFNDVNKTSARLILICDSIQDIYIRLRHFDLLTQKNIYFTTLERLKNKRNLCEAIVFFDTFGNVYSFSDRDLTIVTNETTIK